MLETIREYALEKLDAGSRRGHGARAARSLVPDPRRRSRAQVAHARSPGDPGCASIRRCRTSAQRCRGSSTLAAATTRCGSSPSSGPYWCDSFRSQEGLRWTEAALEQAGDAPPPLRAAALLEWARLFGPRRGDRFRVNLEQARALFAEVRGRRRGRAVPCASRRGAVVAWRRRGGNGARRGGGGAREPQRRRARDLGGAGLARARRRRLRHRGAVRAGGDPAAAGGGRPRADGGGVFRGRLPSDRGRAL